MGGTAVNEQAEAVHVGVEELVEAGLFSGGKFGEHEISEVHAGRAVGADAEAIAVFSRNLKDLLLAAPAGTRITVLFGPACVMPEMLRLSVSSPSMSPVSR